MLAAHPRSRGEHVAGAFGDGPWVGSSPLARGTRHLPRSEDRDGRLIPARAGNTVPRPSPGGAFAAHPRSRGEHQLQIRSRRWRRGSSPLARGTLDPSPLSCCSTRLIPARAGNTHRTGPQNKVGPAHPRSRGEHLVPSVKPMGWSGSSPLARGTPRAAPGYR